MSRINNLPQNTLPSTLPQNYEATKPSAVEGPSLHAPLLPENLPDQKRVFSIGPLSLKPKQVKPPDESSFVAMLDDSRAMFCNREEVIIWNVHTGEKEKSIYLQHHGKPLFSCLKFIEGTMLAGYDPENRIYLWNLETGNIINSLTAPPAATVTFLKHSLITKTQDADHSCNSDHSCDSGHSYTIQVYDLKNGNFELKLSVPLVKKTNVDFYDLTPNCCALRALMDELILHTKEEIQCYNLESYEKILLQFPPDLQPPVWPIAILRRNPMTILLYPLFKHTAFQCLYFKIHDDLSEQAPPVIFTDDLDWIWMEGHQILFQEFETKKGHKKISQIDARKNRMSTLLEWDVEPCDRRDASFSLSPCQCTLIGNKFIHMGNSSITIVDAETGQCTRQDHENMVPVTKVIAGSRGITTLHADHSIYHWPYVNSKMEIAFRTGTSVHPWSST